MAVNRGPGRRRAPVGPDSSTARTLAHAVQERLRRDRDREQYEEKADNAK